MHRLVWPLLLLFFSCTQKKDAEKSSFPPNILWIVAEDLSPVIPSFGDSTITTPNLSRLASEGICYDRMFSPSGVCSPSRAAIATGMYPIHIGANHMRTGPWFPGIPQAFIDQYASRAMPPGINPYEALPPAGVRMFTEYLREAGYYCTNNAKEDYQFKKTLMAWDESGGEAHWRKRSPNQPFFSVFNLGVTHESQIWEKAEDSLWTSLNLEVPIPPYLPDTDSSRIDVRRMYSNIMEMDFQVGEILSQIEEDGLLDNTIIFWYTDHGGPLPRQKRLVYDSGLKVPMIIRFPGSDDDGTRNGQLISFIDLAPTVLSLAGIRPPDIMQGRAFLGQHAEDMDRQYIHAAGDRFDESREDPIRAVRDKRFKYIRYYDTLSPMFYPVGYRDQMPIMRELYRLKEENSLTQEQALWFRDIKPKEELFDTENDPHELSSLIGDSQFDSVRTRLSGELDRWLSSINDLNMLPEKELIEQFWPNGEQPVTAPPVIQLNEQNKVIITCETDGATIGYQVYDKQENLNVWKIYTKPLQLGENERVVAVADRIGYVPSPMVFQD